MHCALTDPERLQIHEALRAATAQADGQPVPLDSAMLLPAQQHGCVDPSACLATSDILISEEVCLALQTSV